MNEEIIDYCEKKFKQNEVRLHNYLIKYETTMYKKVVSKNHNRKCQSMTQNKKKQQQIDMGYLKEGTK